MAELVALTRHSVCPHDCPSACSLCVSVADGRIVDVAGDPRHPFTQRVICGKVHDHAERVYSPPRVLHPMRRVGETGRGEFARISWDDAVEEVAHHLTRTIAQWGPEAILPFSYAGTLGGIQYYAGHPLFHALGASQLDRTLCTATGYAGWRGDPGCRGGHRRRAAGRRRPGAPLGDQRRLLPHQPDDPGQAGPRQGRPHRLHRPLPHADGPQADEHLMIRSGTDGALALGLMHVLIREGLVDPDYIRRATLGFEALRDHVRAYPPARVAEITGLSAETIVGLARRYGGTKAAYIRVGIGLSRHENGEMTCRAIACLPALTGAYAHPAGGALLGSSGAFGAGDTVLERRDLLLAPAPGRST